MNPKIGPTKKDQHLDKDSHLWSKLLSRHKRSDNKLTDQELPPLFQDVSYRLLYTYLCAKCCTIITTALYKTFAFEKIMNQILNKGIYYYF